MAGGCENSLIQKTASKTLVRINAAVAKKGPVAPSIFKELGIEFSQEYLFLIV